MFLLASHRSGISKLTEGIGEVIKCWRRIIPGVLLSLMVLVLPATLVSAAAPEVRITVSAWVAGYPSGFTVTYVSDYEVQIDWLKGEGAENTMVRAAFGRIPESRADGYLVYYGEGISATDWVNLEFMSVPIYYRAWSQNAMGAWEEGETTGFVESLTMAIIGFIALALGLAGLAVWKRHFFLYLAGFVGILFIAIFLAETSMIYGVGLGLLSAYMGWECFTWWF